MLSLFYTNWRTFIVHVVLLPRIETYCLANDGAGDPTWIGGGGICIN